MPSTFVYVVGQCSKCSVKVLASGIQFDASLLKLFHTTVRILVAFPSHFFRDEHSTVIVASMHIVASSAWYERSQEYDLTRSSTVSKSETDTRNSVKPDASRIANCVRMSLYKTCVEKPWERFTQDSQWSSDSSIRKQPLGLYYHPCICRGADRPWVRHVRTCRELMRKILKKQYLRYSLL